MGHGSGVEHVLTELRCRFWVIRGRAAVREVINHCQMCRRRFNAKPFLQMMAPLPKSRVTSTLRAFERVGVDFGGPYLTKQGRVKQELRDLPLFAYLSRDSRSSFKNGLWFRYWFVPERIVSICVTKGDTLCFVRKWNEFCWGKQS